MRLAVFASGSGSNAEVILRAAAGGDLGGSVDLVVTNRPDAGVLDRAARFGIPTHVIPEGSFADAEHVLGVLSDHGVDTIALAGYLKLVPIPLVQAFRNRIVNVHPALLPAFGGHGMYGMNVHRAVIESGARWSGATLHFVDETYDTGPIILQAPVPVFSDDTPESLAARVLTVEHRLYPQALRLLAQERLRIDGRRVHIVSD